MKDNEYTRKLKNGEVVEITNEKEREKVLNSFGILTDNQKLRIRRISLLVCSSAFIILTICYVCKVM